MNEAPGHAGWQPLDGAIREVARQCGFQAHTKPKNGYLAVELQGAGPVPPHLTALADAVEIATGHLCQRCGHATDREIHRDGWLFKLCERCAP
jgi:hypothetical protein